MYLIVVVTLHLKAGRQIDEDVGIGRNHPGLSHRTTRRRNPRLDRLTAWKIDRVIPRECAIVGSVHHSATTHLYKNICRCNDTGVFWVHGNRWTWFIFANLGLFDPGYTILLYYLDCGWTAASVGRSFSCMYSILMSAFNTNLMLTLIRYNINITTNVSGAHKL